MVDCSDFLEDYSDFRDGRLQPDRARMFMGHLAVCSSCARYHRVVAEGAHLVRELPAVEPSCDFMARLQHRLYHVDEEMRARRRSSGAQIGFTLAIAATLGVSAWAPAMRKGPAVVELPAVLAHAPLRVEAPRVLFHPGPHFAPVEASTPVQRPSANHLFYRYSPVGSYVVQPASLTWPR